MRQAMDRQRYLLSRKFVDVNIDDLAAPTICGHPQAFSIAVSNLVRNAFEHTLDGQGPITIRIKDRELLVTNQVTGNAEQRHTQTSSNGYGLGLGIVQRLCERNGWSFSLDTNAALVIARLSW